MGTALVVGDDGIYQIDPAGDAALLVEGTASFAVDDTQGGLLFQVDRGRNWDEPGARSAKVWWIPQGGSTPLELLVPTPGADHDLSLHDAYATEDGFAVLYTRHEGSTPDVDMIDRLRRYDVPGRDITELHSQGAFEQGFGQVSTNGELISATWYGQIGSGCFMLTVDGRALDVVPSVADDSTSDQYVDGCRVSPDGTRLAFVTRQDSGNRHLSDTVHVWDLTSDSEDAHFVVPGSAGRVDSIDMSATKLITNVSGPSPLPALIFDLNAPQTAAFELPIAGMAHFVENPIDIAAPVPSPDTTRDSAASRSSVEEVFLCVLGPETGGMWAVPVGQPSVALEAPASFPRISRAEPDGTGGLVVAIGDEWAEVEVYHFPAGGLAVRRIDLPGPWRPWMGMGTLSGERVLISEQFDWIDGEFFYDCEADPCTPDQGWTMGTGEQVFFAVPLSGGPPIELVRYIGEWGLSGAPDDVTHSVSVGGDRILVARYQYSLGPFDCGSSPQSTCEYSWFEFRDLSGEAVEELHNPAPVPSLSGSPLSVWPTGRLSADGRMLVYESTSDEWATVAVDLDTGRELARVPRHNSWYDGNDILLSYSQAATPKLTVLADVGSAKMTLDLPEVFTKHLEDHNVESCAAAAYAEVLDIDWGALAALESLGG
jgi:hypothetical protein